MHVPVRVEVGLVAWFLAALLPVSASAQANHDWSGFYVGGIAGFGESGITYFDPAIPTWSLDHHPSGLLGGIRAGFNRQAGAWVYGLNADFALSAIRGGVTDTQPGFAGDRFDADIKWIGTLTGRAGYAFGRALLFVQAGVAVVRSDLHYQYAQTPGFGPTRLDLIRPGWTAGGGLEYALGHNWSATAEYDYVDLGRTGDVTFSPLPDGFVANVAQVLHLLKFGFNYRWGG